MLDKEKFCVRFLKLSRTFELETLMLQYIIYSLLIWNDYENFKLRLK